MCKKHSFLYFLKNQIKFCSFPPYFWTGEKFNLHSHWRFPARGQEWKPAALLGTGPREASDHSPQAFHSPRSPAAPVSKPREGPRSLAGGWTGSGSNLSKNIVHPSTSQSTSKNGVGKSPGPRLLWPSFPSQPPRVPFSPFVIPWEEINTLSTPRVGKPKSL